MSRQIRGQYISDKFKHMSPRALATHINQRRNIEGLPWWDIEREVGLAEAGMRRLLRTEGYLQPTRHITTKNQARNDKLVELVNMAIAEGKIVTQASLAQDMEEAGFPGLNKKIINGIIDRARASGRINGDFERTKAAPKGPARPYRGFVGKPALRFNEYAGPPVDPEGLPPRTPELMAKARLPLDKLSYYGCRYTPSEEAPFLFCGEAVKAGSSWCPECHKLLTRKSSYGSKEETSQREDHAIAA